MSTGITDQETSIAAKWWAGQLEESISELQRSQFEQVLKAALDGMAQTKTYIHLGTDYAPDHRIQPILDQVGITHRDPLPWKTMMWIEPNKVHVRPGYGAGHIYLLGSEDKPDA